jgi:FkbM family methyltransferase
MPLRKLPKIFYTGEVLRFILNHPLNRHQKARALRRFLRWQISSRLAPGPVVIPFVENTRLLASPGLMGATGIYYTGLYEYEEMAFTLHLLRRGDRFVDVGAHIGAFSVLAGGVAGASCLAIEPVPASFTHLQDNLRLNGLVDKVQAINLGIASRPGRLRFTTGRGAANAVIPSEAESTERAGISTFQPSKSREIPSSEIEVRPLDALTTGFAPTLLKIDVEGYETEVIAGAEHTLADDRLLAVLIELRGHGRRYGFDESLVHQRLLKLGFRPYQYSPLPLRGKNGGEDTSIRRPLHPLPGINQAAGTTLYIRAIDQVRQRLSSAPSYHVLGQYV